MDSERARLALSQAKRFGMSLHGIRGIDYGFVYEGGKRTQKQGLRFHVARKKPLSEIAAHQVVPKKLAGFPCDVLQAEYDPHNGLNPRDRIDPIQPGISIGNLQRRTTGTLGAIVRDKLSNQPCILSNWHILVASTTPQAGSAIGQPGPDHFGMATPPTVAQLTRWSDLAHGIDAAIAKIDEGVNYLPQFFGLNLVPAGIKEPILGMRLYKYGAVSELTYAIVDGVGGAYVMDYTRFGDKVRWMDGLRLIVDPDHKEDEISLDGDSGSVWVSQDDHHAVALHFGGEDGLGPLAEYALVHSLPRALHLLNVELVVS